jgi:hypothetical protein
VAAQLASALGLFLLAAPTLAGAQSRPTAVVTLGDSYISGEAGRWLGNSASYLSANGTNRSCDAAGCDSSRVYIDGTAKDGCHRSDVSALLSAQLAVARRLNIACSGATTANVLRAAAGGVPFKTERPQDDQLAAIAATDDVKMIVLSIGGNDLDFATLAGNCFLDRYLYHSGPCHDRAQKLLEARAPVVQAAIAKVIADIRYVMTRAHYRMAAYRLVVQTYPSVLPPAARARSGWVSQGCPFYGADLTWAHDQAVPTIGGVVRRAVGTEPGVELLDLRGLLTGHEACAQTDGQVPYFGPPPLPAASEWGRYISVLDVPFDHYEQEFLHPNAYGQMALGHCLGALYVARRARHYACNGAAGETPQDVRLTTA